MLSREAVEVVFQAAGQDEQLVLVGGQAVIFWSLYFADADGFADGDIPVASVDIDYLGSARSAQRLQAILGGDVHLPGPDNHSPNSAALDSRIAGEDVHIDFLASVKGLTGPVEDAAIQLVLPSSNGQPDLKIRVLHPLDCLRSKLSNAVSLNRKDAHAQQQLEATPVILEAYFSLLLEEQDPESARYASRLLRELGRYLETHIEGRVAHLHMNQDPLDILKRFAADERLDERFRAHQLEGAIRRILDKRTRRANRQAPRLSA